MELDYIYDDGGRHHYYRMKFKKDFVGDCAIRACAIGAGQDYQECRKELWEISLENGQLPNNPITYEAYLERKGFVKIKGVAKDRLRYMGLSANRTYVAHVKAGYGTHLVAIDQGLVRDLWDCRNKFVLALWIKE